ncbi:U-box domain-containing protein 33-like [Ananas comosus]|uniref:RING-type E3 ubiquitin transferase n=1 Tax=Ananas comosus TaxID=4615 RepID=A0A6P5GWI2_ANACO|nr:U-box domain-containing protein 33-like [Ananas comosus]
MAGPKKVVALVLVHVHCPPKMISIMGCRFPASKLKEQEVTAHRKLEMSSIYKTMNAYLNICSSKKVRAEKVVIERDDVGEGLVEIVADRGITKLVMGAASEKQYSRKMKMPKSKKALNVQRHARPSCAIWFVCKGNLICTREAGKQGFGMMQPPIAGQRSGFSRLEDQLFVALPLVRHKSLTWTPKPMQDIWKERKSSLTSDSNGETKAVTLLHEVSNVSTPSSWSSAEDSISDRWDDISSSNGLKSSSEYVQRKEDDHQVVCPPHQLEKDLTNHKLYEKLRSALEEAEKLKREVYEETCRRQRAERDLYEAMQKVKASDVLHIKEMKQKKEMEEKLTREMVEAEKLRKQRDEALDELQNEHENKIALEHQNIHLELRIEELLLQRDDAVREAEELRKQKREQTATTQGTVNVVEFSYSELQLATNDFDNSLKIGEGGYGTVYKGFLHHTAVAIKILNPPTLHSQFYEEVNVLNKVRHPNLVTLIGVCMEFPALVYEFMPNGSLEDRLICTNNTKPLTWQHRVRIMSEICSTLIFLHSSNLNVVHGDLKPANILLDANYVAKIGDSGISRLSDQCNEKTTLYNKTHPKGTFAYVDPEYIITGNLTPQSDVYSFGLVILRLLTGRSAFGLARDVGEAMGKGSLQAILDRSAGDWPFLQAENLAQVSLRCCEIKRKNRPNLASEVSKVLEAMMKSASLGLASLSFRSVSEDGRGIPSYFICPILQEIMRDPVIAADGFTYEGEAILGWLESGHLTSPMTNLKLRHSELIPNHALRSAIQEWLQQQE